MQCLFCIICVSLVYVSRTAVLYRNKNLGEYTTSSENISGACTPFVIKYIVNVCCATYDTFISYSKTNKYVMVSNQCQAYCEYIEYVSSY